MRDGGGGKGERERGRGSEGERERGKDGERVRERERLKDPGPTCARLPSHSTPSSSPINGKPCKSF